MDWKSITIIVFSIIFLIFSFISLYFCFIRDEKHRKLFKAFPLITLIVLLMIVDIDNPLIYLALTFGLIGDLFLLSWNKTMFLTGATSFLVEHILVAYLLNQATGIFNNYLFIPFSILLITLPILSTLLLKKYARPLFTIFGGIYGTALIMNTIYSFYLYSLTNSTFMLIISLSYILFIISDSLIARKRFIKPFKYIQFIIMLTYYIAQFGIFINLLLA